MNIQWIMEWFNLEPEHNPSIKWQIIYQYLKLHFDSNHQIVRYVEKQSSASRLMRVILILKIWFLITVTSNILLLRSKRPCDHSVFKWDLGISAKLRALTQTMKVTQHQVRGWIAIWTPDKNSYSISYELLLWWRDGKSFLRESNLKIEDEMNRIYLVVVKSSWKEGYKLSTACSHFSVEPLPSAPFSK